MIGSARVAESSVHEENISPRERRGGFVVGDLIAKYDASNHKRAGFSSRIRPTVIPLVSTTTSVPHLSEVYMVVSLKARPRRGTMHLRATM